PGEPGAVICVLSEIWPSKVPLTNPGGVETQCPQVCGSGVYQAATGHRVGCLDRQVRKRRRISGTRGIGVKRGKKTRIRFIVEPRYAPTQPGGHRREIDSYGDRIAESSLVDADCGVNHPLDGGSIG